MVRIILTIFFLSFIRINSFVNTASALPAPTANPANITTAGSPADTPWIVSNQTDYQPGALVTLTGGGWNGDSEVKIVIEGISGNSKAWNLEKTIQVSSDGSIELKFNLPQQYIPQYKVTATGMTTGYVAANTFADTATPYSLDFCAYNPNYYDFKLPSDYNPPPTSSAQNPMSITDFYHTTESLEPEKLYLGQIVPFAVQVDVNGNTENKNETINLTCRWDTVTTNSSNFGFDPKYMVFAAFVDTGDPRSIDNGTLASVTYTSEMDGTYIKGKFKVSGLDNGDKITVEMWVVLKSELPQGSINGTVQSELTDAETADGVAISEGSGSQTISLKNLDKFRNMATDVSIVKSDEPDPINRDSDLTYTITVANSSAYEVAAKGIVVTDQLDPNLTFNSASDNGAAIINEVDKKTYIVWPEFDLEPGNTKTFTVNVHVKPEAPTENYPGTSPDRRGSSSNTGITSPDLLNMVAFTMTTPDLDITNNVWYEPTNVLPTTSFTAYKTWIGGPEADHKAVTLTLYRQIDKSDTTKPEEVLVKPTITPSPDGTTFTYVWTGLPMYYSDSNLYIYTVKEETVPINYNMTTGDNNTIFNTYKPSLTILKVYGTGPLEGAEFQLYKGSDSGPIDKYLNPVTTGSDGKAVFANLDDGTYWLAEVKPPVGYKSISNIGPIKVANGTITGPVRSTLPKDGATGNYIITVPNQPVGQLPSTGGIGIIPFATGGIGLMILAIIFDKKKRLKEGEKS